ncbi:MAG: hypothetical protein AB8H79_06040 [Myxococcota bacterium]
MNSSTLQWWVLGLCLIGCDDSSCGAHTTEVGGVCVGEANAEPFVYSTIDEVIAGESPCDGAVSGTELDLEARCVGQVCIGETLAQAVQAGSPEPLCEVERLGVAMCEWVPGAFTLFPDSDGDGQPDRRDAPIWRIELNTRYQGTTASGLGIAESASCFVDRLGPPEQYLLSRTPDGRWLVGSASWNGGEVVVEDGVAPYLINYADGVLDRIILD